jgi:tRNA(Ile)-lysidine synthase/bifunctional protein TilS/HprT
MLIKKLLRLIGKKNWMLKLQGNLPREVTLACSGGLDSVAILHFLSNNHKVNLVFVDHQNDISEQEEDVVTKLSSLYNCNLTRYNIDNSPIPETSKEEYWRLRRYEIFHSLNTEVIICHHLNDCVETWIWSSLHGEGKVIPYRNKNVIRPFRLNNKAEFLRIVNKNKLEYYDDLTNKDPNFCIRNYIRYNLMPSCLKVNPGLFTTIRNKILKEVI